MTGEEPAGPPWSYRPDCSDRSWPGLRSRYVRLPPQPEPSRTGGGQVGVSFSAHVAQPREVSGRVLRGDVAPGTVFLTGEDPITWLGVDRPTEALELYLDPSLAPPPGELRPMPALGVTDRVVFGLVCRVRRAHLGAAVLGDLEGSTLAHRLAEHVATTHHGQAIASGGVLSPRQVDHVVEHVEAALAEPLTLPDLAARVALSPCHFARSFRAATGLPPHRYVTLLRLERARHALAHTDRSVADVAASVGFDNLGHFRRLLRRELGVSPAQLRAGRKNRPPAAGAGDDRVLA